MSAKQIDRLMIERAEAQTALDATLSLRERVQREVAEALRRQRSEESLKKQKAREKNGPDRERGR